MKKNLSIIFRSIYSFLQGGSRIVGCLLALLFLHFSATAQLGSNITIMGKVTSTAGEAVPGAVVAIKHTNTAVQTDAAGSFTIAAPADAVLVISSIGFRAIEMPVGGKTSLNIGLEAASSTLGDVVVVGYNSQKRASITGAVSSVDVNSLTKTRIADVGQALQGQVPGVFVAANTGAPGDGVQIRIRGVGTLGNNDVLYVVDGIQTRDISFLNQADIKSMSVLKDAAATAIYGSRSAGGVVIITTNSGVKGRTNINVDYNAGFYRPTNLPKMLNADQYLTVKDQAWHNTAGNAASAQSPYQQLRSRPDLANTNWQKELFTTGISHNAQVSAGGGSDAVQYFISGGYYGQDGIVVEGNDKYQRVNMRINLTANLSDRLRVGTNLQLANAMQDKLSSSGDAPGVIRHALIRPPVLAVYKNPNDPTYRAADPYTDLPFYTSSNQGWNKFLEFSSNPLAIVHFTDDKRNTFQTFGNVFAEYSFLHDKALKFRTAVAADINFIHNRNFARNFGDDNDSSSNETYPNQGRNNKPNQLTEERGQRNTFIFTNTLNYAKTIAGKHSINTLLGQEYLKSSYEFLGASRNNFDNTTDPFAYLDYGSTAATSLRNSGTRRDNWQLSSFFGSATYGFDNKYFVTASARRDGSSRFGPNNRWGFFPSVSGGWLLSQEKFLSNIDWVSNVKLRASWGKSGNQEIPNDAFQTLVSVNNGIVTVTRYGNPDIKWESTTQTDVGIDFSILRNKLSVTADYFDKTTDDILLTVGLPGVAGQVAATYVNAGTVNNKGFELGLRYQNYEHAFKYSVGGNLATITNRVEKLHPNVKSIYDNGNHTKIETGQPLNAYYGLVFDGIYQNAGEITKTLFSNANNTQPGDIKFKDINGDGQIDDNDRAFIGNPIPKLTYAFNFSAAYKNFDFSFLFQGVQGVDRYNDLKQILNYDSRPFNSTTKVLDSWHGEGTSNTIPRLTFNDNGGSKVSSVFVEDASYLRLKNIELGYTLPVAKSKIKSVRIYVNSLNLLTFTSYSGLDPESTLLKDQGTYPQSRAFLVGAKMNF